MNKSEKHLFLFRLYKSYEESADYLTTIKVIGDFIVDILYPIEMKLDGFTHGKEMPDEFDELFEDSEPTFMDKLISFKDKTVRWLEDVPYRLQFLKEYKHRKKYKLSRLDSYMFSANFYSLVRENLCYTLKEMEDCYDMSYENGPQEVKNIEYAMDLCTALDFLDEHADMFVIEALHPEYDLTFSLEEYITKEEWKGLMVQLNKVLREKFADLMIIIRESYV